MYTIEKTTFLKIVKYRPELLIGRQILYGKSVQIIHDISLSGDSILLDKDVHGMDWYPVDKVENPVIIDIVPEGTYHVWEKGTGLTVVRLIEQIKTIKELLEGLNKEVHEHLDK